jgi:hypothetical protein
MPRPNKPIQSGRLDDPLSPSRSHAWTKHGGPGGRGSYRSEPSEVEVTVDDVTIVQDVDPAPTSKYEQRSSAAHIDYGDEHVPPPRFEVEKQWTSTRTIEGRIYTRSDAASFVEIKL